MEKNALLIVLVLAAAAMPVWAETVFTFSDDFESGLGSWILAPLPYADLPAVTAMAWSTAQNAVPSSGSHSMYSSRDTDKMYHNLGQELAGWFKATWYVYDDSLGSAYGEVRAYSGNGWGSPYGNDGLQGLFAAGRMDYHTDWTYYQGRTSSGSPNGWFDLDAPGAPHRSVGWHRFDIERLSDGTVNFYVDSVLGRTVTDTAAVSIDSIAFGNATTPVVHVGDAWFDGVTITGVVPEPSTVLILLTGIAAVGSLAKRRGR